MPLPSSTVRDLPDALHDEGMLVQRMAGRRPAVILDYDGVLTPIVDRPEETLISEGMRTVGALAGRCPVRVVSGRDQQVVQELMRIDDLVVTGSHGSCFVVEDAASGVEAAKADGMAALGLARVDDEDLLTAAKADLVVASLDEVDVERLARHAVSRRAS